VPRIRYETSGREIEFDDDANLLRLSIRYDGGLPWKCATGLCGTDRVMIVEGAEHLSPPRRRERERLGELLDQGVRLACQTYATGPVTVAWDPEQKGIDEDSAAGKRLIAKWLSSEDDQGEE